MLYLKAFHIIFIVTWFAGLFYLPRLYVYHALSEDAISIERFKTMERKLYYGIMYPSMILTIISGLWLLHAYAWQLYSKSGWLHAKLSLVILLIFYHFACGHYRKIFKQDANRHSHVFYRWFNEIPSLLLVAIVILVVAKPF